MMRMNVFTAVVVLALFSSTAFAQSQSKIPTPASPSTNDDSGIIKGVPEANRPTVSAPLIENSDTAIVPPPAPAVEPGTGASTPVMNSVPSLFPMVDSDCNSCPPMADQYMPVMNSMSMVGDNCGCASAVLNYAGQYSASAVQLWSNYSGTTHNYQRTRAYNGFRNRNSGRSMWFSRRGCGY